jgi:hypothetical protein
MSRARLHLFTEADITLQVEYLVVVWTKDDKRVLVSLRQADILKALANDTELTSGGGGVPDLQATTSARFVHTANASPADLSSS